MQWLRPPSEFTAKANVRDTEHSGRRNTDQGTWTVRTNGNQMGGAPSEGSINISEIPLREERLSRVSLLNDSRESLAKRKKRPIHQNNNRDNVQNVDIDGFLSSPRTFRSSWSPAKPQRSSFGAAYPMPETSGNNDEQEAARAASPKWGAMASFGGNNL